MHLADRGGLDAEVLGEDLHRGRRGRRAAVAAVLDQRTDDDLGARGRAVAAPPRLVEQLPVRVPRESAATSRPCRSCRRSRSGTRRRSPPRCRSCRSVRRRRGPPGRSRRSPGRGRPLEAASAAPSGRRRAPARSGSAPRSARRGAARRACRRSRSARRSGPSGAGSSARRPGRSRAAPSRPVARPCPTDGRSTRGATSGVGMSPFPSGPMSTPVGTPSPIRRAQRWSGEPSACVEAHREPVEVRVARHRDRRDERDRLVVERIPVRERLAGDLEARIALDHLVRRHEPGLERGESGHRLEGRARRIETGERPVQRRVVGARVGEALELLGLRSTKISGSYVGLDASARIAPSRGSIATIAPPSA